MTGMFSIAVMPWPTMRATRTGWRASALGRRQFFAAQFRTLALPVRLHHLRRKAVDDDVQETADDQSEQPRRRSEDDGVGEAIRSSDDGTQLEDREVQGDHQATDEHAKDRHDHRLHQARERLDGVIDFRFEEGGDLLQHRIERPDSSPMATIWITMLSKRLLFCIAVVRLVPVATSLWICFCADL